MLSHSKTINVAKVLSPNLALRETAMDFVRQVERLPNPEVIIDFSAVRTVTRSFAHEYQARIRDVHKRVKEANMSPEVARMFAVVQTARTTNPPRSHIDFDGIPVINL